ncbi:MAG: thioredoxin domain-containing protein [Pseudolysinimonas sp.]
MARLQREKQERRRRRTRWLISGAAAIVVLGVVAVVVTVVAHTKPTVSPTPAAHSSSGPENMISDGIVFTGHDGAAVPTQTPAIGPGESPAPSPADDSLSLVRIVTYIDLSCPVCQAFESTNANAIEALVASGEVTLEVRPVAILDRNFQGSRYSSRANNAAACVANFAPDHFLDVLAALYQGQPREGSSGLDDSRILAILHEAGVDDDHVDSCIVGEQFKKWVAAATSRFTSDPTNVNPNGYIGTPTVFANGEMYTGAPNDRDQFLEFLSKVAKP